MKKSLSIAIATILLIAAILPLTYTFAQDEEEAFEVAKTEISKNETLEMTINFDLIEYDYFKFELTSDENLESVEITTNAEEQGTEKLEAQQDENEIVFQINKANTNLSTITLIYEIPESVEVGDIIKLTATITNLENTEETQTIEKEIEIIEETTDDDNSTNSSTTESEVEDSTSNETEKSEESSTTEMSDTSKGNQESENSQTQDFSLQGTEEKQSNTDSSSSMLQSGLTDQSSANTKISDETSQENTVTYNGSDNNYLSELSVEGYDLTEDFSKEKTTYFLNIEDDIDSLEINVETDDDDSTAYVYGNSDLKEGTNKILISVTAENGNVRIYRIYVTLS